MNRYANTFSKDIHEKPLKLHNGVDYTFQAWDFKTNSGLGNPLIQKYFIYGWLPYTEIDNDIYQQISDYYSSQYFYENEALHLNRDIKLSLLAKYSRHFTPLQIKNKNKFLPIADHNWGRASNWSGVACGNFDNDEADEIVSMRNHDGTIYIRNF